MLQKAISEILAAESAAEQAKSAATLAAAELKLGGVADIEQQRADLLLVLQKERGIALQEAEAQADVLATATLAQARQEASEIARTSDKAMQAAVGFIIKKITNGG